MKRIVTLMVRVTVDFDAPPDAARDFLEEAIGLYWNYATGKRYAESADVLTPEEPDDDG